ncbi:MAG: hypothetical protein ABI954_05270 [Pyrinomonadaceae bacterium]
MSSPSSQIANQDRLEVLLAMAIAFNQTKKAEASESDSAPEQITDILSALNMDDLRAIREKLEYYDVLTDEEKRLWQLRVLNRVKNRKLTLDKDVHYTQIAEFLRTEPVYIGDFILQRLSPEMAENVAVILERKPIVNVPPKSVNADLENLVRRRFLSNFTARESLFEIKPLLLIAGDDLLEFIQRLGQNEIAFVCRGVKDVESLAPFLRRFDPEDSQEILEQMARLRTVEKKRVDKAESLVKGVWANEKDPALIVQLIGLEILAAALSNFDKIAARFLIQKLPSNLAAKINEKIESRNQSDVEMYENEAETLAARILLEKMEKTMTEKF